MCDLLIAIIVCAYGSNIWRGEREKGSRRRWKRGRESGRGKIDFHFPGRVCLSLNGASLVPRQTAQWLFFFSSFRTLLLSTCSTLSHRNVHHVLFRSRDQHCCASVLRTCRLLSPVSAASPPVSRILAETRFRSFLIILIIFITLFRIFAIYTYMFKKVRIWKREMK